MSASTVDNAVVVTITSATTATTTDGIKFSAISSAELQEQILDYAHHLASSDDQPILLELRNPATGRGDVIEMPPDGDWYPAPTTDTEPSEQQPDVEPTPPIAPPPADTSGHPPIAADDGGDSVADEPVVVEPVAPAAAAEYDSSPWRGSDPGHTTRPRSAAARPSRGPHVPPPSGGRLRTVWRRHRTPLLVIGLITLVVMVGIGVAAGRLLGAGAGDTPADPAVALGPPTSTADPTSDEIECPTRTEGATTTGRDPGNQTSAPNAIKAFNYGYYKWRSGNAARAVVSSNAKVGTAIQIQSAIDVLDPDLRYCLSITDRGKGVYGVELTEIPPIGQSRVIRQKITTTEIGGKYWIAAIEKDAPKA